MIRLVPDNERGGHDVVNRQHLVRQHERWQQLTHYYSDKLEAAEERVEHFRSRLYALKNEKGEEELG